MSEIDWKAADAYVEFVRARHLAYVDRSAGAPPPWSDDPIIQRAKFTNVFRILDKGSQFLLTELLQREADRSWADLAFRCFAYRYTNRPEPWVFFYDLYSRYPTLDDLHDGTLWDVWQTAKDGGIPIFGNAYQIYVGKENKGMDRLSWLLGLLAGPFSDLLLELETAETMAERHRLMTTLPRCADFMAMQVLTDIGYFDPMHNEGLFIVPGPGSIRGAKELGLKPREAFRWARIKFQYDDEVALRLPSGKLRHPSLMDIQNTFCEFSKYARYSRPGDRPARGYRPSESAPTTAIFPAHWDAGFATDV